MISYAQNYEDVMLARAFGDRTSGFYVDIGACYPDIASVTKHFYDLGWHGINVEPMAEPFARLAAARPRDVNVQAAIAGRDGEIVIYEGATVGEATTSRPHPAARGMVVPCLTLTTLCRRHCDAPIDFLKVDVEGGELDVLAGGDWTAYRPAIVVVEVTRPWSTERRHDADAIAELMRTHGYDEVHFDGLNAFFLARTAAKLAERFRAPPNVLDHFTSAREAELDATVKRLEAQAAELTARDAGRQVTEECNAMLEQRNAVLEQRNVMLEQRNVVLEQRLAEANARGERGEQRLAEIVTALKDRDASLAEARRAWEESVTAIGRLQAGAQRAAERIADAQARTATAEQRAEAWSEAAREAQARAAEADERAARWAETAEQAGRRADSALAQAEAAVRATVDAGLRATRLERELIDAGRRVERLHAERLADHERAEAAVAALAQARSEVEEARAYAIRMESEFRHAQGVAGGLDARLRALEAHQGQALARLHQAEHTVASMLASRSWRLTAPLRAAGDLARWLRRSPQAAASSIRAGMWAAVKAVRSSDAYARAAPRLRERYPGAWRRGRAFVGALYTPVAAPAPVPPSAQVPGVAAGGAEAPVQLGADPQVRDLTAAILREIAQWRRP